MLYDYEGKSFTNICAGNLDLDSDDEKEELKKENEESSEMLNFLKDSLSGAVSAVRFTNKLKNHPVCLTSEGMMSLEMEKVLSAMPGAQGAKATVVLEINKDHKIADTLKALYTEDKDKAAKYAKILYAQSCLIAGKSIENPTEYCDLVCDLM